MYVAEGSRGRGYSTAILRALEDEARSLGMDRLVLETGLEQPDAIRLYTREGYDPIPLFGHYVGSDVSVCFGTGLRA